MAPPQGEVGVGAQIPLPGSAIESILQKIPMNTYRMLRVQWTDSCPQGQQQLEQGHLDQDHDPLMLIMEE